MTRTFIQTEEFAKNWEKLGFTDDDLRKLELEIMKNPMAGDIISGTGGLRKLRFPIHNKGKRGSVRVCYVDFLLCETIYLITVYAKSNKENLSLRECQNIKKVINILEKSLLSEKEDNYE